MANKSHNFVKKQLTDEFTEPLPIGVRKSKTAERLAKKEKLAESPAENFVASNGEREKIKNRLQEIYKNDDGTMPDMADFKKNKRNRLITAFFFLLFSCLILFGVVWIGFFILQPLGNSSTIDVSLAISGEQQITSGQEVTYRVSYRNEQSVPLSKVVLQVRYPAGFVFSSSSINPTNDAKNEWQLGSLKARESDYLDISGKLYGSIGAKQSVQAFLNYYTANFSSEFQKVANLDTEVSKPLAELQIEAPAEVAPGSPVNLSVTIKKTTTDSLKDVALVLDTGKIFNLSSSSPAADNDNSLRWTIAQIDSVVKINLSGVYIGAVGQGNGELKFSLLGYKGSNSKKESYVLAESVVPAKFSQSALSASLVVNSSTSELSIVPGQLLNTVLTLNNNASEPLNNIEVTLIYDTPSYQNKSLLDWKKFVDANDGDIRGEQLSSDLRRGLIFWDAKKIDALKQIDPGKSLQINFAIPLKDKTTADLSSFKDSAIQVLAEIKYKDKEQVNTISVAPIKLLVNSDLKLEVRNNESVNGQGKEEHSLAWILTNSFHELKNIEISADIFGDVSWQADKLLIPAGEAKFDAATKKLVWKVGSMPLAVDTLALQFGLLLNSKNLSQTNLTSVINLKATDTTTGQTINQTLPGVLLQ